MKAEKSIKVIRTITRVLIPVSFFAIANVNSVIIANAIAGVMFIATIFVYVVEAQERRTK